MKTLSDVWLEKSFKYLRKIPNGKDGWRYIYEEPHENVLNKDLGPEIRGFKGRPREALNYLLKHQKGQIVDVIKVQLPVVTRQADGSWGVEYDEKGKPIMAESYIDLIWGTETKGLNHILTKHYINYNDYNSPEKCCISLAHSLENINNKSIEIKLGNIGNTFKFKSVDDNGNAMILGIEIITLGRGHRKKDYIRHFVITSYDSLKSVKEKKLTPEEISLRKKKLQGYFRER